MHIREDEADRVVQLVRHARDQPAERRHLLGEDEVLLRLLQLAVRLIEALIGAAQLAKRPAHHHAAGVTSLMVEPRGAIHREGGGRSARIPQANLAIGDRAIHAQLCQHLLDVPSAAGVENRGERLAGQFRFASARDLFECEVNALDAPRPIADRQHVRHGREHARNQRLSFLKRRVFALKLDLVLDKLGVNGIHLLDDLDPGVLACAGRARRPERRPRGREGSAPGFRGWRLASSCRHLTNPPPQRRPIMGESPLILSFSPWEKGPLNYPQREF